MSRTALDGFPLEAFEKDFLLDLIKRMSGLFFSEIYGFALMGNHFHLLVKMIPEDRFTDEEVKDRLELFYGEKKAAVGRGSCRLSGKSLPAFPSLCVKSKSISPDFTTNAMAVGDISGGIALKA
jgi:hypothetical protein